MYTIGKLRVNRTGLDASMRGQMYTISMMQMERDWVHRTKRRRMYTIGMLLLQCCIVARASNGTGCFEAGPHVHDR